MVPREVDYTKFGIFRRRQIVVPAETTGAQVVDLPLELRALGNGGARALLKQRVGK